MREKRLHLRVPLSHTVLCEPEAGEPFAAILVDLGLAGSCIESAQAPTFGTRLVLALHLPGVKELSRLPAVVRWTKPGKFGVQFGLLGARDTKAIAELMAQALHRED